LFWIDLVSGEGLCCISYEDKFTLVDVLHWLSNLVYFSGLICNKLKA
jgi:hypothetical protein